MCSVLFCVSAYKRLHTRFLWVCPYTLVAARLLGAVPCRGSLAEALALADFTLSSLNLCALTV